MIVLGLDPGTATTGYAIIKLQKNNKKSYQLVDYGLIKTDKNTDSGSRLIRIYTQINSIIDKYKPQEISLEKIFFATNAKTAINVGMAQGIMLYAAARKKIKVYEYAPGTIKKIIAGSGKADKKKIQKSLRLIMGPKIRSKKGNKTHFDDSADALAIALCHMVMAGYAKIN